MVTHEHDIAQCAKRNLVLRDGQVVRAEPVAAPRRPAAELARREAADAAATLAPPP